MQNIPFHEIASIISVDRETIDEVKADIQKNGQQFPVILYEGKVLDGRHRYIACTELGIDVKTEQYTGVNPARYVISTLSRRNFKSKEQLYLCIKRLGELADKHDEVKAKVAETGNKKRSEAAKGNQNASKNSPATSCGDTERDHKAEAASKTSTAVADEIGVNRGAVERAEELDKKRPDLAQEVAAGEITFTAAKRKMKKDEVSEKVAELPQDKYRIIYADPPWKYNDTQGGSISDSYGAAEKHYPSMTLTEICNLPIKDMATDDSVLFLWVTSPLLPEGLKVAKEWGYTYKSAFVWDKVKHNMGHYNSVRHELLFICTKGSCTPDIAKLFDSVQEIERTKHSAKPEEFRAIIDTIYPYGRRIELFRRGDAPDGWDVWGNESENAA
jgi:N6-adenosine-specific RNA methylase IME4